MVLAKLAVSSTFSQPSLRIYMTNKTIYGRTPFVSSIDNTFHYVYRITNLVEGKHYYGSRTSSISPMLDLGSKYFGSPSSEKNRWIIEDQKDNPEHYQYKILKCFNTRKEALAVEILLHKKFDVKYHEKFYNEQNQTSTGFQYSLSKGHVYAIDIESGKTLKITSDEYKTNKQKYKTHITGKTTVTNSRTGEKERLSQEEYAALIDEYIHPSSGVLTVIEIASQKKIRISSQEYQNNRHLYSHTSAGKITAKDKSGKTVIVSKNEFNSENHIGITKGMVPVKLIQTGETLQVQKEEFAKNKELYQHNVKGRVRVLVIATEESKTVSKEEFYSNRHLYLSPKQIPKWRNQQQSKPNPFESL